MGCSIHSRGTNLLVHGRQGELLVLSRRLVISYILSVMLYLAFSCFVLSKNDRGLLRLLEWWFLLTPSLFRVTGMVPEHTQTTGQYVVKCS